jgi:hypothetical protein
MLVFTISCLVLRKRFPVSPVTSLDEIHCPRFNPRRRREVNIKTDIGGVGWPVDLVHSAQGRN